MLIPLTQGMVAIIDDEDADLVRGRWYVKPSLHTCYAQRTVGRRSQYMHRLLLPDAAEVDHINRNGLDNRRSNLRAATRSQQTANSRTRNHSSLYRGVSWDRRGRWVAYIHVQGRKVHLGWFLTADEAAVAYNAAASETFGEFASLNTVPVERTA